MGLPFLLSRGLTCPPKTEGRRRIPREATINSEF